MGRTSRGLNTLFVRYGCGTDADAGMKEETVLIPYSSGMGVGRKGHGVSSVLHGLNTLFVRYGCGTLFGLFRAT